MTSRTLKIDNYLFLVFKTDVLNGEQVIFLFSYTVMTNTDITNSYFNKVVSAVQISRVAYRRNHKLHTLLLHNDIRITQ